MPYVKIAISQLSSLKDAELVHLEGLYTRHLGGAALTQGDYRLNLLGEPFTHVPTQGARVEIWGLLLQGPVRRLYIHDAAPIGAENTATPVTSETGRAGDRIALSIRNDRIGQDQIVTTADRHSYFVIGEELARRHYMVVGRIVTLTPPTLEIEQAVPVAFNTIAHHQ